MAKAINTSTTSTPGATWGKVPRNVGQKAPQRIECNTAQYEFSHGKKPRGRGYWAFEIGGEVFWSSMNQLYAEAVADVARGVRRTTTATAARARRAATAEDGLAQGRGIERGVSAHESTLHDASGDEHGQVELDDHCLALHACRGLGANA